MIPPDRILRRLRPIGHGGVVRRLRTRFARIPRVALLRDGFERVASDRLIDRRKRGHHILALTRERWLPKAPQDGGVLLWFLVTDGEGVQQWNRTEVAV